MYSLAKEFITWEPRGAHAVKMPNNRLDLTLSGTLEVSDRGY